MSKKFIAIGLVNYFLILIYLVISMLGNKDIRFVVFVKKYFVLACAFNIVIFLALKIVDEISKKPLEEDEVKQELGSSVDFKLEDDDEIKSILTDSIKLQNDEKFENSFNEISFGDINKIN
ncbi:hypothetical protein SAMN02745945_00440 [Peptoclostridium litorale DSM 5388]|uniref:Uncharacterized protein n=1 Tax=Peptoclostridium litorale DSM 5388 TaxID=1121324 RepID=A0A069RDP5_PEPLI|nr:hypothetical protein [Peptoclostridium litorale]KDR95189.1 hypothetical protein CLIT_11c02180 [Peptoclostridium litorale DSM 5388]SIN73617.1 hypothetical protein SAMN02745945_00440 [Peptoclostridium litorale DSM 5388]